MMLSESSKSKCVAAENMKILASEEHQQQEKHDNKYE